MIARAAEGSVRDCLSIFDQAIAHGDGKVTADAVRQMLGLGDRGRVVDLFEHLMKGDAAAALARVPQPVRCRRRPCDDPHRPRRIHASRHAAALRAGRPPRTRRCRKTSARRGTAFSQSLSLRVLSRTWQMLLKGIPEVQAANRPVSAGEMVLIRIAHAANLPTLDEALKIAGRRLARRPAGVAAGARASAPCRQRQRRFGASPRPA